MPSSRLPRGTGTGNPGYSLDFFCKQAHRHLLSCGPAAFSCSRDSLPTRATTPQGCGNEGPGRARTLGVLWAGAGKACGMGPVPSEE